MCVRYTLHKSDEAVAAIAKALARKLAPPEWAKPRYNITVTSVVPVAAFGAEDIEIRGMMWGFMPGSRAHYLGEKQMIPNAKRERRPRNLPSGARRRPSAGAWSR